MPKLDDIMPFITPQTAMMVVAVLALLVVTLVLVTLAVGRKGDLGRKSFRHLALKY